MNAKSRESWTALHLAAQNRLPEAAQLLLENGAEVDPKNKQGNTPLQVAVTNSRGEEGAIKVLLAHGADRNHENNYGVSPLKLAHMIANYDVAQFFSD